MLHESARIDPSAGYGFCHVDPKDWMDCSPCLACSAAKLCTYFVWGCFFVFCCGCESREEGAVECCLGHTFCWGVEVACPNKSNAATYIRTFFVFVEWLTLFRPFRCVGALYFNHCLVMVRLNPVYGHEHCCGLRLTDRGVRFSARSLLVAVTSHHPDA